VERTREKKRNFVHEIIQPLTPSLGGDFILFGEKKKNVNSSPYTMCVVGIHTSTTYIVRTFKRGPAVIVWCLLYIFSLSFVILTDKWRRA
jgi:hypothetical protein